jgi:hypothetical protein
MTSVVNVSCGVIKPGYGIGVASYSKPSSTYGESYTTTNTPYQVRHCRCERFKKSHSYPDFLLLFTEIRNDYCQVEFVLLHSGSFVLSASTTSRYFLPSYSTAGYRTEAPTYYSTAASYFSAPSYASPSYKAEAESHYATTATYYTSTAYTTSGYYTTAGYYYESTAYFAYTTAAPHYDVAPNYGAESDHHEYEPFTKSSSYSAPDYTTDGYRYEEHGYHTTTSSYAYGPAPFTTGAPYQAAASYYFPSDHYSPYDLESTPGTHEESSSHDNAGDLPEETDSYYSAATPSYQQDSNSEYDANKVTRYLQESPTYYTTAPYSSTGYYTTAAPSFAIRCTISFTTGCNNTLWTAISLLHMNLQ